MSTEGISGSNPVDQASAVGNTTAEETKRGIGLPAPTFGSMEQLQKLYPKAYEEMIKGMAENMMNKSRKDAENFKKILKEGQS